MSQFPPVPRASDDFWPPHLRRPADAPLPVAPAASEVPGQLPVIAGVNPIAVCGVCGHHLYAYSTIAKDCHNPRSVIGGTRPDQKCPLHDLQWKASLGLNLPPETVTEVTPKADTYFTV